MASKRGALGCSRNAGMWPTIAAAVQAGWGPTGRLLTVFAVLGFILIGITVAAGDSDMVSILRKFLVAIR